MLTPDDIKELKPQFEEIHRHLNVALIKSGVDVPPEARAHFFEALLLMEDVVHKVEQKIWYGLTGAAVVPVSPEVSILKEMIWVLGIGDVAEASEDFQEFMLDFQSIHSHLNIAVLRSWGASVPNDACNHFAIALSLMKNLTHTVEYRVWEGIKASASRLIEEDYDKSSWWENTWERAKERTRQYANPSAEKAGVLGMASGGTLAAIFTGGGGFGIAAGGTAVGVAGLAGATVATGGAGLAGAAALYLLYKGGEAALNTEQGRRFGGRFPWGRKRGDDAD